MGKPFHTYEKQLEKLKSRGLIIDNDEEVIKILKRKNYYDIINGYKDYFIDVPATTTSGDDVYKEGTNFKDINLLYEFDAEIRSIILKNILKLENIIKTKISYVFSKEKTQEFNYLNINNYDETKKENATRVIAEISNVIRNCMSQNYTGGRQISHYLDIHKNLPLWVLAKQLTFGNISYFYSSIEENLQKEICEEIASEYEKEYGKIINVNEKNMEKILKFINSIRNICAHNERLYNITVRINKNRIPRIIHPHIDFNFRSKLFDVLIILKLFITRKEFQILAKEISNEIRKLGSNYSTRVFGDILNQTGIPIKWKRIIGDLLEWEEIDSKEENEEIEKFIYVKHGDEIDSLTTISKIEEIYLKQEKDLTLKIAYGLKLTSYVFKLYIKKVTIEDKKITEEDKDFIDILDEEKEVDKFEKENNFKDKIIKILNEEME